MTDDFYHLYEGDLDLLQGYGMNAMRVSISWPRLQGSKQVHGFKFPQEWKMARREEGWVWAQPKVRPAVQGHSPEPADSGLQPPTRRLDVATQ